MIASVVSKPRWAEARHTPTPMPGSGEIRVRIEGCGVCGSNLPVWEGKPWFTYPLEAGAPGHEAWGTVDEVGDGVGQFRSNDRVAILSSHAFAEFDVAPASQAVLLPVELAGKPFPAEPLACAMNAFERSGVRAGQSVAIVGVGFLGALLTRLSNLAGARVAALSRRPFSLQTAELFGADACFPWTDQQGCVADAIRWNHGRGFDCVIEAVGSQAALDVATQLTTERGRLVIAGYHQDGPRRIDMQAWNWRGLDVINAHERNPNVYLEGMRAAVAVVSAGKLDPFPLYTHSFKLKDASQAFEMLRLRPEGFLKALVIP